MKRKTVLLIPGHGGKDRGTFGISADNGSTIYESRVNLNVALRVAQKLTEKGIDVVMTRTADVFVSPAAQLQKANSRKWDAVVAIHHNGAASKAANGFEILHNANPESERLADAIAVQFKALGQEVRGTDGTHVSPRDLALKKCRTSPLVYTEFAFLTGPDIEIVDTLEEQHKEANAIAYGTLVFLGEV